MHIAAARSSLRSLLAFGRSAARPCWSPPIVVLHSSRSTVASTSTATVGRVIDIEAERVASLSSSSALWWHEASFLGATGVASREGYGDDAAARPPGLAAAGSKHAVPSFSPRSSTTTTGAGGRAGPARWCGAKRLASRSTLSDPGRVSHVTNDKCGRDNNARFFRSQPSPAIAESKLVDERWAALEARAAHKAPDMTPRTMANTLHAYDSLGRMPGDKTWKALETATGLMAWATDAQDVTILMSAYAQLGRTPGNTTWAALETAVTRVARNQMNVQGVMGLLTAFAKLQRNPAEKTWVALEAGVERVAPEMTQPRDILEILHSYKKLSRIPWKSTWEALAITIERMARVSTRPQEVAALMSAYSLSGREFGGDETWVVLEAAAGLVTRAEMNPGETADLIRAYVLLGMIPGDEAWVGLDGGAELGAPGMTPQEVADTLFAYKTFGRIPADKTWAALDTATVRIARYASPGTVANALFAYAALTTLRGVEHPSCYAVLWDRMHDFEARDFSQKQRCMLYHVHLMHLHLPGANLPAKTWYPTWLMVKGRDAWTRSVRDKVTVSKGHDLLAKVFDALGVRNEMERVTNDGCFSMDIYLPGYDVAVEFDGPWHYYNDFDTSFSGGNSRIRTAETELRDLLLTEQCTKVVTVPWFELSGGVKKLQSYVRNQLEEQAGITLKPAHAIVRKKTPPPPTTTTLRESKRKEQKREMRRQQHRSRWVN